MLAMFMMRSPLMAMVVLLIQYMMGKSGWTVFCGQYLLIRCLKDQKTSGTAKVVNQQESFKLTQNNEHMFKIWCDFCHTIQIFHHNV